MAKYGERNNTRIKRYNLVKLVMHLRQSFHLLPGEGNRPDHHTASYKGSSHTSQVSSVLAGSQQEPLASDMGMFQFLLQSCP
ncbi:hypothetical protein Ahy_B03g067967 isoform D [Arachis hypogaea]|uniref:Uncharacterized protein n=1 Tax=Arachis hypogaea TaxID=3818 RepID=A0A445A8C3_ARAHY|nr:hypothetical protein Ahy_B03g067967 isoform D [Arachis hypogaea]